MKLSFNWLKELVDFSDGVEALADRLTSIGTAVDGIEAVAGNLENIVVGKVTSVKKHPRKDKLSICRVELGKDLQLTVVCGAPNVREGMKSALALPGAELSNGMKVKSIEFEGVESEGVLCSEEELGISDDHSGIMEIDQSIKTGSDLKSALSLDDYSVSFDLTPNRADCLSAIGIAREIAAITGSPLKRPKAEINESKEAASALVKVRIEDPDACPRYAARIIKDIKVGPSPWWMQQRLLASGVRSINNVVDITNYVMLEYGQPLHAFDFDNFSQPEVVVRRARDGEQFRTLDGVDRKLNNDVLLITDGKKPVAIGGIMGGEESEVSDTTSVVLLEAAYFNAGTIRRGRKHLGLTSESQTRFERGCDPNIVPAAIDRAASLLEKYAGGQVCSGIVDEYPQPIEPLRLELRPARVNQILATDMSAPAMIDILNALEFRVSPGKNIGVDVPTFRPDIEREIDLIEEVARIYGYDKIPTVMRAGGDLVVRTDPQEQFTRKLRAVLMAQGYFDAVTNSIGDPKLIRLTDPDTTPVELLNPISEDLKWLRPSLAAALLNVVRENISHQVRTVKVFEIGTVFANSGGSVPEEHQSLGLAISGNDMGENWAFHPGEFSVHDIIGSLEEISGLLNSGITVAPAANPRYEQDCSFVVKIGEEPIGDCGKVAANILKAYGIKFDVYIAELRVEPLFQNHRARTFYAELPRYPGSERDIAVIVDEQTPAGALIETIRGNADERLRDVIVFDLYRGKQVDKGKKSVALRLTIQDESKTLTDEEIDSLMSGVVTALKNKHGAELRAG